MKKVFSGSCDHLGLFTSHAQRLERFYTRVLGFRREKEEVIPKAIMKTVFGVAFDCRLVKLTSGDEARKNPRARQGGVVIELFQPLGAGAGRRRNGSAGYNHWGYVVGDRESFCRVLHRKNVPVITVRRGTRQVYFIKDPDGNRIEIRE